MSCLEKKCLVCLKQNIQKKKLRTLKYVAAYVPLDSQLFLLHSLAPWHLATLWEGTASSCLQSLLCRNSFRQGNGPLPRPRLMQIFNYRMFQVPHHRKSHREDQQNCQGPGTASQNKKMRTSSLQVSVLIRVRVSKRWKTFYYGLKETGSFSCPVAVWMWAGLHVSEFPISEMGFEFQRIICSLRPKG